MLRIYEDWMKVMPEFGVLLGRIAKRDLDLARQGRKTTASVALNIAEGFGQQGGNKRVRYESALGACQEARSVFEVAALWGYIEPMSEARKRFFNSICMALAKLSAKKD
jgi:four helix bundle protein